MIIDLILPIQNYIFNIKSLQWLLVDFHTQFNMLIIIPKVPNGAVAGDIRQHRICWCPMVKEGRLNKRYVSHGGGNQAFFFNNTPPPFYGTLSPGNTFNCPTLPQFQKHLKTVLFQSAFIHVDCGTYLAFYLGLAFAFSDYILVLIL